MKPLTVVNQPKRTQSRTERAFILATPLWGAGLAFLIALFALTSHGEFQTLPFLALALLIVLGSTIAVMHVMDGNQKKVYDPHSIEYRRMQLRARRLRGVRFN